MSKVTWTAGAEKDLLEAFERLEDLASGRGETFTLFLDERLERLSEFPLLGPSYAGPVRRLVLGLANYAVFYTVEPRGIFIQALLHLGKDPEAIRRHLRNLLGPED